MSASEHFIVITRDHRALARLAEHRTVTDDDRKDHYDARIECTNHKQCPGWIECMTCREHDPGIDLGDEIDDVMVHGQEHTFQFGYWTVEDPGCPVQGADWEVPYGIDTTRDGRYKIDTDWDEEYCSLTLIEEDA